ncbi:holo-[acyl-carrier protein] synthase [Crenobacter luteus]|uniref:holo-ACP synthase n=1 Tax=Crenobacter luteus TaxID=1452487 RepID=UPI001049986A|nr:holo-ACP synthase [Crenobacter luteus]TCP11566.1 holo-[acyl-carrier protein] synthase [Crenobacter luteus]
MIVGIGTDLARVERFAALIARHGRDGAARRILSAFEAADYAAAPDAARFLAKRFAAKEALSKALGTGVRAPVVMSAMTVAHDTLGKPLFELSPPLAEFAAARGIARLHLSISDEREHAVAFVVAESADA